MLTLMIYCDTTGALFGIIARSYHKQLITKITVAQNEVLLSVRGIYFMAVIFAATTYNS